MPLEPTIDQLAEQLWLQTLSLLQAVREADSESVRQLLSSRDATIGELEGLELSEKAQTLVSKTREKDPEIMMALESQHIMALETLIRSRREAALSREYGNTGSPYTGPGEFH